MPAFPSLVKVVVAKAVEKITSGSDSIGIVDRVLAALRDDDGFVARVAASVQADIDLSDIAASVDTQEIASNIEVSAIAAEIQIDDVVDEIAERLSSSAGKNNLMQRLVDRAAAMLLESAERHYANRDLDEED